MPEPLKRLYYIPSAYTLYLASLSREELHSEAASQYRQAADEITRANVAEDSKSLWRGVAITALAALALLLAMAAVAHAETTPGAAEKCNRQQHWCGRRE